jgi:hypothetical protein
VTLRPIMNACKREEAAARPTAAHLLARFRQVLAVCTRHGW